MEKLGLKPSQEELDRMIAEVDTNKNGKIEFDEFLAMMTARLVRFPTQCRTRTTPRMK